MGPAAAPNDSPDRRSSRVGAKRSVEELADAQGGDRSAKKARPSNQEAREDMDEAGGPAVIQDPLRISFASLYRCLLSSAEGNARFDGAQVDMIRNVCRELKEKYDLRIEARERFKDLLREFTDSDRVSVADMNFALATMQLFEESFCRAVKESAKKLLEG